MVSEGLGAGVGTAVGVSDGAGFGETLCFFADGDGDVSGVGAGEVFLCFFGDADGLGSGVSSGVAVGDDFFFFVELGDGDDFFLGDADGLGS